MLETYEARVDEEGNIRLVAPVTLPAGYRVLLAILEEPSEAISETSLPSEPIRAVDWNRPEEDEAWSHLQQAQSS